MIIDILRNVFQTDKRNNGLDRKQMAAFKEEQAKENQLLDAGTPCPKPAESNLMNSDYAILARKYGDLEELRGRTLTIELNEAAALLNRTRKKVDAFAKLKSNLMRDYQINLIIYSRRTK